MKIKFNKNFGKLVGSNFSFDAFLLNEESSFLKNEEIVSNQGIYYFKRYAPQFDENNAVTSENDYHSKSLIDKSGEEYFFNKLFVDDLVRKVELKLTPQKRFSYGMMIAVELIKKLQKLYNNGFTVVLSYNYEHCYVRFYKERKGENILDVNLDNYKNDAILKISI